MIRVEMKIRLKQPVDVQNIDWPSYDESSTNHPLLRLWNQVERKDIEFKHGSVQIKESNTDWLSWKTVFKFNSSQVDTIALVITG